MFASPLEQVRELSFPCVPFHRHCDVFGVALAPECVVLVVPLGRDDVTRIAIAVGKLPGRAKDIIRAAPGAVDDFVGIVLDRCRPLRQFRVRFVTLDAEAWSVESRSGVSFGDCGMKATMPRGPAESNITKRPLAGMQRSSGHAALRSPGSEAGDEAQRLVLAACNASHRLATERAGEAGGMMVSAPAIHSRRSIR